MGWKIGAPSLKLNNAGTKSKSCGDFGAVAREALKEREGHDPDIDQGRAELNRFVGYQTAAELQEYSRQHVDQLKDAKGRKLRKDAVVMCATILKPPAAMMNKLPIADQRRFLDDSFDAFVEIVGRDNVKSRADHFDELGAHTHVFWEPMTKDGRLCAKEMHNLQFFGRVNRELPQKLRDKGWDIEDCEMYDAAKEQYDEQKNKNAGRSSVAFKADAERQKAELIEDIEDLNQERTEASQRAQEARQEEREAKTRLDALEAKIQAAEASVAGVRELEEIFGRRKKTITGKEIYRRQDAEQLRKAAEHGAVVDYKVHKMQDALTKERSDNERLRKANDRLQRLKNEEKRLEQLRIRELEKKNEEIQGLMDLVWKFLDSLNLRQKFEDWMERLDRAAEIQRRQERVREKILSLEDDIRDMEGR